MIISDLNYLETAEQNVEGAWGSYSPYTYYQYDKVKLDIYTDVDLDDNSAEAFGDALAVGNRSFTKTFTFAGTSYYHSESSSGSFSAVD